MKPNTWKITIENEDGTYSVEKNVGGMIDDVMEDLVRPVLLAASFGEKLVDEYIYGDLEAEKTKAIEIDERKKLEASLRETLAWCETDEREKGVLFYSDLKSRLERVLGEFF